MKKGTVADLILTLREQYGLPVISKNHLLCCDEQLVLYQLAKLLNTIDEIEGRIPSPIASCGIGDFGVSAETKEEVPKINKKQTIEYALSKLNDENHENFASFADAETA